jgi:hypothetical protein
MRLWSNSIDNLRNEDWAVPLQEMGRMKRAPIFPHNIQGILLEVWNGPSSSRSSEIRGSFALPVYLHISLR